MCYVRSKQIRGLHLNVTTLRCGIRYKQKYLSITTKYIQCIKKVWREVQRYML